MYQELELAGQDKKPHLELRIGGTRIVCSSWTWHHELELELQIGVGAPA
jgi:hypothetical protein